MPVWIDVDSVREPATKLVTVDVGFGVGTCWVLQNRKAKQGKHFLENNFNVHSWDNTWQISTNNS